MSRITRLKNASGAQGSWVGQTIEAGAYFNITPAYLSDYVNSNSVFSSIATGNLIVNKGVDITDDILDPILGWIWLTGNPITANDDGRPVVAINCIPIGYTLTNFEESSNITSGNYRGGSDLKLEPGNPSVEFQFLDHFYLINALAIWEGADLNDTLDAKLYAPATTGLTNVTGDFDKVNLGGGANIIIPNPITGAGAWDLDLTVTLNTNVNILQCSPVLNATKTGKFDYNHTTNTITANFNNTGGYDLYDFDIDLHWFCSKVHGRKQDGSVSNFGIDGVIGKLLFNVYKLKATLNTIKTGPSIAVGIGLALGVVKTV